MRTKRKRYYRKSVAYRRKAKGGWSRSVIWGLFLILFVALGHVWQRVTVLKITREIKNLSQEVAEVEKKYKYLNVELASLSSVERIESVAMNDLGMFYPKPEKIIYLDDPLIVSPDKQKDTFVLWTEFKKMAKNFPFITEERLEAKEIKHDL